MHKGDGCHDPVLLEMWTDIETSEYTEVGAVEWAVSYGLR
ncbi:hypothetical protein J2S01_000198 [Pectinatus haikarae]|uniref:Uncharacterized protein n=1 Tax=Pectinatus haikarae TaxID=349096 RepID=A0ABT9Y4D8_9FIRM|nr:hypothetical protein [Pectinatus haikarae]